MDKWVNLIRALVRPIVTWTGWFAFLVVAVILILRFADANLAQTIATTFMGIIATLIGFWFGQRRAEK